MITNSINKYLIEPVKLYKYWRSNIGYKPIEIEYLVTSQCNLKCRMCNIWKIKENECYSTQKELSLSEIVKFLEEISLLGTKVLTLSGGEPLLRKDIFKIISKAKKENLDVGMITNGTLVTKKTAENIIKSGLDNIYFSIDSPIEYQHDKIRGIKGTWKNAINGMYNINQARNKYDNNLRISVFYVITSNNYQLISKMIELKSKLKYDEIYFSPIIPKTKAAKPLLFTKKTLNDLQNNYLQSIEANVKKIGLKSSRISTLISLCKYEESTFLGKYAIPYRAKDKILCFQPWLMATVDPFGNVYPCCHACTCQNLSEDMEHGFWGTEDYNMGNIRKCTFKSIWNNQKFISFRNECKVHSIPHPICPYCDYGNKYDAYLTALFKEKQLFFKFVKNFLTN